MAAISMLMTILDSTMLSAVTGGGQWKTYNSAAAARAKANGMQVKSFTDAMGWQHEKVYEPNFVERWLKSW